MVSNPDASAIEEMQEVEAEGEVPIHPIVATVTMKEIPELCTTCEMQELNAENGVASPEVVSVFVPCLRKIEIIISA